MGAFFTQGAVGYATLLTFSLATITGSMFVLSTRQSNEVIFGTQRLANSALSTGASADFKPETPVRTVIVNFEGGVATGLREAVTNLAGAIRAVSSNIINEALREDAARAAALAARPSAFGLSADSQLAAGAGALGVPVLPPQPTAIPVVPTTAATAPVVPTTAPPAPTAAPPTQAPPASTALPPTQPTQPTAVPATPVPPTGTPLPPAPTATPVPQLPPQPEATTVPSQPTAAADQPTPAAALPTTLPGVATVAAVA